LSPLTRLSKLSATFNPDTFGKAMNTPLHNDERFYDLFKTFLPGLCSQFENQHSDGLYPDFYDGASELERCKQIVERAWTLAEFATAKFNGDESAIRAFNKELNAIARREEAEREKLYREAGK
jgi:hypothetical protein